MLLGISVSTFCARLHSYLCLSTYIYMYIHILSSLLKTAFSAPLARGLSLVPLLKRQETGNRSDGDPEAAMGFKASLLSPIMLHDVAIYNIMLDYGYTVHSILLYYVIV